MSSYCFHWNLNIEVVQYVPDEILVRLRCSNTIMSLWQQVPLKWDYNRNADKSKTDSGKIAVRIERHSVMQGC